MPKYISSQPDDAIAKMHPSWLQVEVILQGWQLGSLYGHLCSGLFGQHAAFAVWILVCAVVSVVHGADPLGCVFGNGHSWVCIFLPVHIQNLCICEGRLSLPSVSTLQLQCNSTLYSRGPFYLTLCSSC